MTLKGFARRFVTKFVRDETTTLAASLAFYAALSLAPLVILFVAVSSRLSDQLQDAFTHQVRGLMGEDAARTIDMIIEGAKARTDLGSFAGLFGVLTILISASIIFGQLRTALNRIFGIKEPTPALAGTVGVVWQYLHERLLQIGFALIFIALLVLSTVGSMLLSNTFMATHGLFANVLGVATSLISYAILFTAVFRFMPDRTQPWRKSFQGGILTSVLFEIGKVLLAEYLGRSAVGSPYGAAGSLIVLLVWVYYSSLITFVGAQVSSIWSDNPSATP